MIDTDASLIGWGAVCNAVTAKGSLTASEVYYTEGNINVLELLAIKYKLQSSRIRISSFVVITHLQYLIFPIWEVLTLSFAMQLQKKYGWGP